jgi:hypothetical protein
MAGGDEAFEVIGIVGGAELPVFGVVRKKIYIRPPGYSIDSTDRNFWCFCLYASMSSDHVFVW